MKFKDLKIGRKQKIVLGFLLLIMTGANIFSIHKLASIKTEVDTITKNWLPRAIAISNINLYTSDLRRSQLQYAFAADEESRQELAREMIPLIDQINERLDTYDTLKVVAEKLDIYSEEEQKYFSDFEQKWEAYQDLSFMFFKLSRENKTREALAILNNEGRDIYKEFRFSLVKVVDLHEKEVFDSAEQADKTYRYTRNITIILLAITITFAIAVATIFVRMITRPIAELEGAAGKISEGDLNVYLDISRGDEIGKLARSFNHMTHSLREAKRKTERQARELRKQAEKLQITNEALKEKSQSLEKQKAQLEQTMEELRNTQEQLLMKEKMAALGDLVAGVAHEINNPVGTVNSSIDITGRCVERIEIVLQSSRTIDDIKNNRQLPKTLKILKDNINVTMTAGNRIATIVRSLKNFARLDQAEYQQVDIHEGIDSALTLLGSELQHRIEVIKTYGNIPRITCYPGQLNQVFMNLLKNAMQAIEGPGTIGIKTCRDNGHIQVQISDSGRGISAEELKKIFDFGFSSDGIRVKLRSGLSTAYNIIQRHDGQILVDSEIGKGTTFSIILPIK